MNHLPTTTPLASVPVGVDAARCDAHGATWHFSRFTDGAVDVDGWTAGAAMLPPLVAANVATLGDAIALVLAARDRPMVAAMVATVIGGGVTLTAPARGSRGDSATCGPCRDAFACEKTTDGTTELVAAGEAFDVSRAYVNAVGVVAATWSYMRLQRSQETL